jgi:TolB-like protein/class 3 adenylate cyclase/Tfp pilus assembly protein PilF
LTGERVERRLAAVLAADVAGYSRIMGADEEGTLKVLKAHRKEVVDPAIAAHKGRIVKTTGDGMLVEFASVVDAVTCAVVVQAKMAERNEATQPKISFRIGINIGDIIIDEDDIFGDGVNVAARVEGECEPGGVYLSGSAFDQVRSKTGFAFDALGEKSLKNIDLPVRLYAVNHPGVAAAKLLSEVATKPPSLPDKPSIAVLPFQNMSGDPQQEYFADGMAEDIITALSQFGELFVIARNSTFTYKGKAIDIRQVGRELGVRYVLEGSVRKAGNQVRITGQLVDASSGAHLWADHFDGSLQDIFNLQDQVTARVANAIAPKIEEVEINRAAHKPTENLDAYDYFLRGLAEYYKYRADTTEEALRHLNEAIRLDPDFALAFALAAACYFERRVQGAMADVPKEIAEATRLARRAAELGKNDATALCYAGLALAYVAGDIDAGAHLIDRALLLNPNSAAALHCRSWIKGWIGEPDQAIDDALQAIRLSPFDPRLARVLGSLAYAHFFAGRYGEASTWAEKSLQNQINPVALRVLAASTALAGKFEEARAAILRLRHLDPALHVSHIKKLIPIRRSDDLARLEEGLRLAGLPE